MEIINYIELQLMTYQFYHNKIRYGHTHTHTVKTTLKFNRNKNNGIGNTDFCVIKHPAIGQKEKRAKAKSSVA